MRQRGSSAIIKCLPSWVLKSLTSKVGRPRHKLSRVLVQFCRADPNTEYQDLKNGRFRVFFPPLFSNWVLQESGPF